MPIVNSSQYSADQQKIKKRTPQEQKRFDEGNAYIQQREKLASQLQQAGHSPVAARRLAAENISQQDQQNQQNQLNTDQVPVGASAALEQNKQDLMQQMAMPSEIDTSKDKTLTTKAAEAGLTPATTIANIGGGIVNKVSNLLGQGDVYKPQTTEQLSQTGFGKVLGTATAATGAALSLIGLQNLVAGTAIKAVGLRLSATSLLTGGGVLGVFNVKSKYSDAKKIVTDSKGQADDIIKYVDSGLYSPEMAMDDFNRIESNLRSAERSIKIIQQDSIKNYINGGKDSSEDIRNAIRDLNIRRELLANAILNRRLGIQLQTGLTPQKV